MFTEIAPGIFSVDHQVVEGKNGIVCGSRAALAIDTRSYPEEGRARFGPLKGFVISARRSRARKCA